jgi:DNA-binding NarL/FixJ family response regulator
MNLTRAQVEVLELLAAGRSNTEISAARVTTVKATENHINRIFLELGVTNRVQAARWWWEHHECPH